MVQATSPEVQHMQAPASTSPKLVKIRALSPIVVRKNNESVSVAVGQVIEVSEDEAKEFADRIFVGHYGCTGEHGEAFAEQSRHKLKRAERVQ